MTTGSAHIVTVGIAPLAPLTGTESAVVGATLMAAGMPVASRVFIDDDEAALERALGPGDALTVIIAGPGGSEGDIVRRALARAVGARLVLSDRMRAALEDHYRYLDRPLPRQAERLALLPQGATVWTAGDHEPAWVLESGRGAFVVLPTGGAINELLKDHLLPFARARFAGRGVVLVRTLRTAGVSAAEVEDRLTGRGGGGDVTVITVPTDGEVWVRVRARGANLMEAAETLEVLEGPIARALGVDCYGQDRTSLEEVVARLLIERKLTLSVAESCTGGLLGHRLTNVAGSSRYFERGVVVYSNQAKQELLGVPESILRAHGAVSGPTAEAMASSIAESAGSQCGLAITGIAGPDGGTAAKPVGTVFIGLAFGDDIVARRFHFAGDRRAIKWQSTQMALDMLRRRLEEDRPGGVRR